MILTESEIHPRIREWHNLYQALTGLSVQINCVRIETWRTFMAYGQPPFTHQDLRGVVKLIHSKMDGKFLAGRLRFDNLIHDVQRFEEDLAEVRQLQRPRPPATIVATYNGNTNKIVPNPGTGESTRSMADVIAEMRRAANGA